MPLFRKREDRTNGREDKKENRRNFRIEKIQEVTAKTYAVAAKRKWLFLLIAAIITGYLVFKFV